MTGTGEVQGADTRERTRTAHAALRPQFRLSTLLAVVLLAGSAMGGVRAWRQWDETRTGGGDLFVSHVLVIRGAGPAPASSYSRDAIPLAGSVSAALCACALWRRLRGRRTPTP
ncbi:MAG: hypothetical protein WKF75_13765 [Singulisphaera sp.]